MTPERYRAARDSPNIKAWNEATRPATLREVVDQALKERLREGS